MRRYLAPLLLIVTVFAVYGNTFDNEFLYDDEFLIQKNVFIRSWEHVGRAFTTSSTGGSGGADSFYRPLQTLTYLVIYQIYGLSPHGYHLISILLHALNALLVWRLGQALGFDWRAALAAALVWAVHPLHTESITYMSGIADPMHTLFVLMAALVWVRKPSWTRSAIASGLFLLALLSKEAAIVFPALAMTCVMLMDPKRPLSSPLYARTLPFWGLAFVYLIARKTILDFDDSFTFYKVSNVYTENMIYRVYTFLATVPEYIRLMVWPSDLHMDRRFPVFVTPWAAAVGLGAVVLAGLIAQWLWSRGRRGTALAWGTLWFSAAYSLHAGILVPMNALILEHWLYLPSTGLFLGLAQSIRTRLTTLVWQRVAVGVTAVIAIGLGWATHAHNQVWKNPFSFYENILKYNDQSPRIHNNLAMAYSDVGQDAKAMEHYEKAIALSDEYPQTRHNLGLLMVRAERYDEAILHLERAIALDANFYHSYGVLAQIHAFLGQRDKAAQRAAQEREIKARLGVP